MEEPVNLSWHQVTSEEANAYFTDAVANVSGVNVISPTWFYLQDTQGNIADISSADYVKQEMCIRDSHYSNLLFSH